MKYAIYGIKCKECDGRGYKLRSFLVGGLLKNVKEICGDCNGSGVWHAPYENRDGVKWERE